MPLSLAIDFDSEDSFKNLDLLSKLALEAFNLDPTAPFFSFSSDSTLKMPYLRLIQILMETSIYSLVY